MIILSIGIFGLTFRTNQSVNANEKKTEIKFQQLETKLNHYLQDPKSISWLFDWADGKQATQANVSAQIKAMNQHPLVLSIVKDGKIKAWSGSTVIKPERLMQSWLLQQDSIFVKSFNLSYNGQEYEISAQIILSGKYLSIWQAERSGKLSQLAPIKDLKQEIIGYKEINKTEKTDKSSLLGFLLYLIAYTLLFLAIKLFISSATNRLAGWKILLVLALPILLRLIDHVCGAGNYVDKILFENNTGLSIFGGVTLDALISVFTFLNAALYATSFRRILIKIKHTKYGNYKLATIIYALEFIGIFLVLLFCKILVVNSGIIFDFNNLLNLGRIPFFFILILSLVLINLFLCTFQLSQLVNFFKTSFKEKIISVSIAAVLCLPLLLTANLNLPVHIFLLLLLLYALIFDIFVEVRDPTLGWLVIWIIFYSAFAAVTLFKFNRDREALERNVVATQLSSQKDPLLITKINEIILQLKNNKQIYPQLTEVIKAGDAAQLNDIFRTVLSRDNYLTNYYDFSFGIATGADKWVGISPIYDRFVKNKKLNWIKEDHLVFASHPDIYHGGLFKFYWTSGDIIPVPECYILAAKKILIPKTSISDGSKQFLNISNLSKFDYAIYNNGRLLESQGTFYPDRIDLNKLQFNESYTERSISHRSEMIKKIDAQHQLIVGRELNGLIKPVSLFSFIYVLILFIVICIALLNSFMQILPEGLPVRFSRNINLRQRIEYSIILVIVFSFGAIAFVTSVYFRDLSKKMEQQQINEKSFTLVSDIEHKLRNNKIDSVTVSTLMDLRRSHQTTYLLYNLAGDQIFNTDHSTSDFMKMDPVAYLQLAVKGNPYYYDIASGNEQISKSYLPVRNNNLEKVAWLEIPVNASFDRNFFGAFDFLGTLLNVYVFLLLMAGAIAIVIANSITKPIVKLVENVKKIRLGKKNEIILWNQEDEIGILIKEYNNMIGQLESSAEILARSEREGAWREMARQVAHEIKNPLTPMRLSAQYLIKRIEGKTDPEVEASIRNTSKTLIEQIDNLATIANEFSNFAVMPAPVIEYINLSSLVASVYDLFRKQEEITMNFSEPIDDIIVMGDRSHLIRLMNNLIKNAIQSIPHGRKGKISISLEQIDRMAYIRVKDNGIGITEEMRDRVFSPNFTTKSKGMGLGLALSKSIVETFGGQINFESVEGQGTEFMVAIPVVDNVDLINE